MGSTHQQGNSSLLTAKRCNSCKDTGKKTRRYTVKTDDVIEYLRQRAIHPDKYKAGEGWYAKIAGGKKIKNPQTDYRIILTAEQTLQFEQFFETEMKDMTDFLTAKELAIFFRMVTQPQ